MFSLDTVGRLETGENLISGVFKFSESSKPQTVVENKELKVVTLELNKDDFDMENLEGLLEVCFLFFLLFIFLGCNGPN